MQQAGWYPDPSGAPNSERFWDGTAWTTQVRPAGSTAQPVGPGAQPLGPGSTPPNSGPGTQPFIPGTQPLIPGSRPLGSQPAGPGQPYPPGGSVGTGTRTGSKRTPLVVGAAAVVLIVAVVLGLIFIPGDDDQSVDPPVSPPVSEVPTAGPGEESPGPARGELDCWAGNQSATGSKETPYISTGLAYEAPDSWGFRFSKDQWTWLDDQAVWGAIRPSTRGVALGGLNQQAGFTDPARAGEQHLNCLMQAGVYAAEQTEIEIGETTQVEVNGMEAYQTEATVPGTEEPLEMQVLVFPTRTSGSVAVWMGFWAPGDEAAKQEVLATRDTIKAA